MTPDKEIRHRRCSKVSWGQEIWDEKVGVHSSVRYFYTNNAFILKILVESSQQKIFFPFRKKMRLDQGELSNNYLLSDIDYSSMQPKDNSESGVSRPKGTIGQTRSF